MPLAPRGGRALLLLLLLLLLRLLLRLEVGDSAAAMGRGSVTRWGAHGLGGLLARAVDDVPV